MGLFNFLRRKKPPAAPAPSLKEIWQGFQQLLAANNAARALMGELEEKLSSPATLDLPSLRGRVHLLDRRFAELVAALRQISGEPWRELEAARLEIAAAINRHLDEETAIPPSPLLVRLKEAGPALYGALGGKAGNLARVKNELQLPVPDGVVATLAAYRLFMEAGPDPLLPRLKDRLARLNLADEAGLEQASREIRDLILAQPIPPELSQELLAEARRLAESSRQLLVVRSSGGREDVAATFAGQFESFLAVAPEEVPERWRQVVASQFGQRAMIYFKLQGLDLAEAAMGVLIQGLVAARGAGVMFTTVPGSSDPGRMVVSATWGLAADLVGGQVGADEYVVLKETGQVLWVNYARKEQALTVKGNRLERLPVPPELVAAPVLTEGDLSKLAAYARALEAHCGVPHGVEWVKDEAGELFLVQSRHLLLTEGAEPGEAERPEAAVDAQVLLTTGHIGAPGVGAGPVFHLPEDAPLSQVPPGAVLVAPRTTPRLAPVLPRIAALVTDVGSIAGHLALVAREYGVPALVGAAQAGQILPPGEVVTVDAYHGRIYRGRVEELLGGGKRPPPFKIPSLEKLRSVADLIVPLTLVDRRSPEFRPENCRTYHDIVRFANEKAIQEMLGLMDQVAAGKVPALRLLKLQTTLPLNLHLVDLGDGLASHETPVPPADILSRPMRALWRGISHPGITWAGPVPVDVGGFLHVLGQSAIRPPEKFWDKTYAIVGANYVNYACRLGYHFQSVDSYIGDTPENNYINFTFKGGAADDTRRIRRIRLIALVLERLGFEMEIHGDVIRGRFRRRGAPEMEERLDLLGRLMAYVRQMDMLMSDDNISQTLAERFLGGHYERPGLEGPEGEG
jgi:pyruvate,water dikinase